jgi:hypothetical protein
MASQDRLLTRIATLIRGFDDASWEALASKGLLRRARKELDGGLDVQILGETEALLTLAVPPFQVGIPAAGPARAQCTCPAPGICQHILAAGLFLQTAAAATEAHPVAATPEAIRDEIVALSLERLKAWAGSADFRAGAALFEKNSLPSAIEYTESILIRLMPSAIEARYVPRGGLDGMILPRANPKRVAVAALLALRQSLGLGIPQPDQQQSLLQKTGGPRTHAELLASVQSVLEDAVTVGLSHLSPNIAERLVTLAVSTQGANLPRVSLALKALSDEVYALARRNAQADEARLFLSAARVYALTEAIKRGGSLPDATLMGTTRSQYIDVPEMQVFGVGAYTWKTRSGYAGLTLLFWSNTTREFLSWSEARPQAQPAAQQFDPRQRFFAEGPWDGTQSPRQAASSALKLRNARRTASGRISGSAKTGALVLSPTRPETLAFGEKLFTSWSELRDYASRLQPLGLGEANPLDRVVMLEPTFFDPKSYDSVAQTFRWDVYDAAGERLQLTLPFEHWSQNAIRTLEGLNPPAESRWRIVANITARDGGLEAQPVSILQPENRESPIFHLAFDAAPVQPAPNQTPKDGRPEENDAEPEEASDDDAPEAESAALESTLAAFEQRLAAVAEAGATAGMEEHRAWFSQAQAAMHRAGFTALAATLGTLAAPSQHTAANLLKARYLLHLHAQARSGMQ